MKPFRSIEWKDNSLLLLDQKKLPHEVSYLSCSTVDHVFTAIVDMTVRGAPALSIAAAYGVVIGALNQNTPEETVASARAALKKLKTSRPTAVNLFWALEKVEIALAQFLNENKKADSSGIITMLLETAHDIYQKDIETNLSIAKNGFELIPDTASIIHHCNTELHLA